MDWKEFFWATKEKTALTIGLFVLLNIFFLPQDIKCDQEIVREINNAFNGPVYTCEEGTEFLPIWQANILMYTAKKTSLNLAFEIVYLGFSFLVSCIVFHFLKKGGKKNG